MAQMRARIKTPYPSVDSVVKEFGLSKQRAKKIVMLVDRLLIDERSSRSKAFARKLTVRRRLKT
jgi:hypothetical protein